MDTVRDKKCVLRRRVIHKALLPVDSTLRSHRPLSKEIAFAKSVILPNRVHPKNPKRDKERCKVIKELIKKLINPSFGDMIHIVALTKHPDETTIDLNKRNEYKRHVSIL